MVERKSSQFGVVRRSGSLDRAILGVGPLADEFHEGD